MEPLTGLQALSTALTVYEKASKVVRELLGKLPDTPTKDAATKDLKQAEEAMEIAKVQVAESLGYVLCRRHFPPGIMLDVREGVWSCQNWKHNRRYRSTSDITRRSILLTSARLVGRLR
jgi:hypothetical protein